MVILQFEHPNKISTLPFKRVTTHKFTYPCIYKASNGVRHLQQHKMKDSTQSASDILIEHWQKGTTLQHLPEDVRPADAAAGYEIQRHIERLTGKSVYICGLL